MARKFKYFWRKNSNYFWHENSNFFGAKIQTFFKLSKIGFTVFFFKDDQIVCPDGDICNYSILHLFNGFEYYGTNCSFPCSLENCHIREMPGWQWLKNWQCSPGPPIPTPSPSVNGTTIGLLLGIGIPLLCVVVLFFAWLVRKVKRQRQISK